MIKVSEWPKLPLNEIADLTLSSVDKKSKPNEESVRLCNYMDVYSNSFISTKLGFMDATATEREIANCSLLAGDVVITKDSEKYDDISVPALVREDVPRLVCGYHLAILRPQPSCVDGAYLFYALNDVGAREQFHSYANGVTRFSLRKSDIGLVQITLPPLPQQRRIASILGALDDRIELNRQMNETLEQLARALFQSWFVNFDPVRAKLEGRWRRGQSLPCLPAELYDLFPNRLVPSELGEIPEGWEVKTLGDEISELVSGRRPRGGATAEGIPSIGAENVIGLGRYDFSREKYIPYDFYRQVKAGCADVRNGDVLLYKDGAQIGRKTYFDCGFPHPECAVNEHVFILRLLNPQAQRYLFFWLDQQWLTQEIVALNSNSAQPGINRAGLRGLPLLMPSADILAAFDSRLAPLTDRVFANCHNSRSLAAQRDTLLPKLLSGEIQA